MVYHGLVGTFTTTQTGSSNSQHSDQWCKGKWNPPLVLTSMLPPPQLIPHGVAQSIVLGSLFTQSIGVLENMRRRFHPELSWISNCGQDAKKVGAFCSLLIVLI